MELYEKAKEKMETATEKVKHATWKVFNDPETQGKVIAGALLIGTVVKTGVTIKNAVKPTQAEYERALRDRTYYDPHERIRFDTRRKLRNDEILLIRERTRNGEKALNVLREMGLSK